MSPETHRNVADERRSGEARAADAVWAALYSRQLPRVRDHACAEYLRGLATLRLPGDRVPGLAAINGVVTPRTGWRTLRTSVRYTDAVPWYRRFARREFLVTDYMRRQDELDFTPEPDMFHDIFGHLPFFVDIRYARLQERFAAAFLAADPDEREAVKRLAWFSTEFGLLRRHGRREIFGAGLLSGAAELANAIDGAVPVETFRVEAVLEHEKAVWSHNEVLFEFASLDALERELNRFFAPLFARGGKVAALRRPSGREAERAGSRRRGRRSSSRSSDSDRRSRR